MPDSTWIKIDTQEQRISNPFSLIDWIKNNRQTAIGILVISIAILVFGIFFYINYSKTQETAQKQLFIAQQLAYTGKLEEGVKLLSEVETNFPNKPEADFAIFTKGDLYFNNGEYQKAIYEYEKILKRNTNKDLHPFALYSIAKSYQAIPDYNTAIVKLKDFLSKYPENFLTGQVYLSLAYIYEKQNDMVNAKETYEKIMVLFPETQWAQLAKDKLNPTKPNSKK